jgi:PAS domain-containing protein
MIWRGSLALLARIWALLPPLPSPLRSYTRRPAHPDPALPTARQRSLASRRRGSLHPESSHVHTSYGHNVRKFSLMTDTSHGLIEAQGPDLKIVTVDPRVCRILGWATDAAPGPGRPPPAGLPATVHELLPPELRGLHRRLLAHAVAAGRLPDALQRPMRAVEVRAL